ncbi:redoxin domain-containing protein [Buchnera aphidicola]|uniref:redoxin domain-containing protein n=1 Tax=Buchnera aphidicola TaxID=9 RepID=UPI0022371BB1|nr:redoxin domain-containing protein [Buchnera aphidicola]MCW5197738.1 redoxin domain-containing protein [Buchnera aphidicola (Chaitophorus viminalis)]
MTLVTQSAPDFITSAILENGNIIDNFHFKKYISNSKAILFFWPMDFTFVCPSEIIAFNQKYEEFKKRNVKIVGISFDSVFVHAAWQKTKYKNGGIGPIKYVMASDIKRKIQKSYFIEHPNLGMALRASFLIDETGIIRHEIVNDLPYGRNIQEMIRMIDALDFHKKNGEVCPANWTTKKEGIKPTLKGISKYLSKNKII